MVSHSNGTMEGQQLDAERLWVGKINHLPMPHCNLMLTSSGKLVLLRAIAAGEARTFDCGVQWWAYRVTGLTWNEWMSVSCRNGRAKLFDRMRETVLDYTPLLDKQWDKRLKILHLRRRAVSRQAQRVVSRLRWKWWQSVSVSCPVDPCLRVVHRIASYTQLYRTRRAHRGLSPQHRTAATYGPFFPVLLSPSCAYPAGRGSGRPASDIVGLGGSVSSELRVRNSSLSYPP